PARQDVRMHMEHGLSGVRAGVEDQSEVAITVRGGHLGSDLRGVGEQRGVLRELGHVPAMCPGHDEHMHRSLRVQVLEGDHVVVLVDALGGDVPGDDLAEDAVRIVTLCDGLGEAVSHARESTGARNTTTAWGTPGRYAKF